TFLVLSRPWAGIDPFDQIDNDIAKAVGASRGRGACIGGSVLLLDIAQGGCDGFVPRPRLLLRFQHIGPQDIATAGRPGFSRDPLLLSPDLLLLSSANA